MRWYYFSAYDFDREGRYRRIYSRGWMRLSERAAEEEHAATRDAFFQGDAYRWVWLDGRAVRDR